MGTELINRHLSLKLNFLEIFFRFRLVCCFLLLFWCSLLLILISNLLIFYFFVLLITCVSSNWRSLPNAGSSLLFDLFIDFNRKGLPFFILWFYYPNDFSFELIRWLFERRRRQIFLDFFISSGFSLCLSSFGLGFNFENFLLFECWLSLFGVGCDLPPSLGSCFH